jgi:hypothetical protein
MCSDRCEDDLTSTPQRVERDRASGSGLRQEWRAARAAAKYRPNNRPLRVSHQQRLTRVYVLPGKLPLFHLALKCKLSFPNG